MMRTVIVPLAALCLAGCSSRPSVDASSAAETSASPKAIQAQLLGSDKSWGNTEGPAVDSKGTLYFTSRGTWKGIVSWNPQQGFQQYLAVATGAGPGGLWIDNVDNIYVTATDERQILKVSPEKKVTVIAKSFEANAKVAKGPNDLVVARDGTVYFTDPNGYDGSAPNGTVYVIKGGKTSVFSSEITGPNGVVLSADEKTLYVSHNVNADTSKIVKWSLNGDGTHGPMSELTTVKPCVADGMAVDKEGAMWLTCYSHGTAYRVSRDGKVLSTITTEQKALTNAVFGRAGNETTLYLTSSDMSRVVGYVYQAKVSVPGLR
ncbi:MAG TPA: SMP-30/gluconolactonase/LRE family protein [Bryobacteraceae bacterium]|nr:SMP-30/gluconolactonase/LRE family protein [Bryobacteraceae bacterium]